MTQRHTASFLSLVVLLICAGCAATESNQTAARTATDPSPSSIASAPGEVDEDVVLTSQRRPTATRPAATKSRQPTPSATKPPSPSSPTKGWRPSTSDTWQYQLTGKLDTSVSATVFDVDASDTTAAQVAALHAKGRHVVCYISAGSWEKWRTDSASFPAAVQGKGIDGWPGEKWLDIRRTDVLIPLMSKRLDACVAKGFDGVEFDNVDGYTNSTGFPLTAAHQLTYNKALADAAHARGLAVGLKNDVEQVPQLVGSFDFAVNESCMEYSECSAYAPFVSASKPVFHVEYTSNMSFCTKARSLGLISIAKGHDLDAARKAC